MKRRINPETVPQRPKPQSHVLVTAVASPAPSWPVRWMPLSLLVFVAAAAAMLVGTVAPGQSNGKLPPSRTTLRNPHLIVIKSNRILHLLDGDRIVRSYPIDLGVAPVGQKRRANDGRTPEGSFRIVTKNANSPYHRFIGIDYPGPDAVAWGLASGLISPGEAKSIRSDLAAHRRPSWDTALGGGIGLHGHGNGRAASAVASDWTGGCIALSDEHIEEIFSVVRKGDPIDILP